MRGGHSGEDMYSKKTTIFHIMLVLANVLVLLGVGQLFPMFILTIKDGVS